MSAGLHHDALVYSSDDEYVAVLAPFVRDGVTAGEQVLAGVRPERWTLVQDALGGATAGVRHVDARAWYSAPPRTIAGYDRELTRAARAGARVRVIGEVEFGGSETDRAEWTRYEALLNVAFAHHRAWIVCPYDTRVLPAAVVDTALRTHPSTLSATERRESTRFVPAATLVGPIPLAPVGALVAEHRVGASLRAVREVVAGVTERAGCSSERVPELCVAVTELVTNALRYGRAPIDVRVWHDEGSGELIFEVADAGGGWQDPFAGFLPPTGAETGGAGLWLARQLADRCEVATSDAGTRVRLGVRA
jgi:anti-sigma regulatory factor (Ser/Thr protein kinase)